MDVFNFVLYIFLFLHLENNKVKKPLPSTNQSRPLPSAPPPGGRGGVPVPYSACGTSIDHESDDEVMEG